MKKSIIAVTLLSLSFSSHAFWGLFGDDDNKESTTTTEAASKSTSNADTSAADLMSKGAATVSAVSAMTSSQSSLTDMLSSKLPIDASQAASGAGALLALAQNNLSPENNNELSSLVPGLSQLTGMQGMMGKITSLESVQGIFEKIGLSPDMISQFAPLLLNYIGSEGASAGLLASLSGLWSAK